MFEIKNPYKLVTDEELEQLAQKLIKELDDDLEECGNLTWGKTAELLKMVYSAGVSLRNPFRGEGTWTNTKENA